MILPLRAYNPTQDAISALAKEIDPGKLEYSGLGTRLYSTDRPENPHLRFTYRKGARQGNAEGWNADGDRVYKAKYSSGNLVAGSEEWEGEGSMEEFLAAGSETQEYARKLSTI